MIESGKLVFHSQNEKYAAYKMKNQIDQDNSTFLSSIKNWSNIEDVQLKINFLLMPETQQLSSLR